MDAKLQGAAAEVLDDPKIVARLSAAVLGGAEERRRLAEAVLVAQLPAARFIEAMLAMRTACPEHTSAVTETEAAVLHAYDDQLARFSRLATIGQLAATVGHDIRNPLGVIESSLFILRRRADADAQLTKHLDKIARQINVCEQIVTDLLDMARDSPPRVVTIDVGEAMRGAVEEAELPDVYTVAIDVEAGLSFQADRGLLRRALVNLIANAVRALGPDGGTIMLQAAAISEDRVRLSVLDDGPGFDNDVLAVAFEPLVTTRSSGVGLGLALVRSIVLRHRGCAVARNRPEGGARVDLELPRSPA